MGCIGFRVLVVMLRDLRAPVRLNPLSVVILAFVFEVVMGFGLGVLGFQDPGRLDPKPLLSGRLAVEP